ncbi:response regulator [Chitinophagaceae bacterium LB-8]|uniref:Response regulator n=1 Tax=Paraflavisolibacter caeni TaxID=2982496 RepID=A0A9X2Y0E8_9BACT|nr:response regulator [Paraflavisolibacter caeni]MCU7552077.1 response regulator [Paraflavisolibacter caeni]
MHKILVIDDDPDMITVIKLTLKKNGYEVASAAYEAQAYEQVNAFKPDLILLDVLLSGSDGRNICKFLKSRDVSKHIPVIVFSGHPSAQKNIRDYGADDFLAKPFQESDLLGKVKNYLPV